MVVQGAVANVRWQMTRSVQTSSVSMSSHARRDGRAGEEQGAEADPRGGGAASRAAVERNRQERLAQHGSHSGWRPRSALARLEMQQTSRGGGQGSGGGGGLVRQKTVAVKAQNQKRAKGEEGLVEGTPIPRSFGEGIYANFASASNSGYARPQSAFSYTMLSRGTVQHTPLAHILTACLLSNICCLRRSAAVPDTLAIILLLWLKVLLV